MTDNTTILIDGNTYDLGASKGVFDKKNQLFNVGNTWVPVLNTRFASAPQQDKHEPTNPYKRIADVEDGSYINARNGEYTAITRAYIPATGCYGIIAHSGVEIFNPDFLVREPTQSDRETWEDLITPREVPSHI